jgi:hypothetical protein
MTTPSSKRLVSVAAVAAFLAGCSGGSQTALSPAQSGPQTSHVSSASLHGFSPSLRPVITHLTRPSQGKSFAAPDATSAKVLLYVSEIDTGTVDFYKYNGGKNLKLKGTLTGFEFPTPGCTDNKGNVFIPDFDLAQITEYAYGSSTPTQVLSDSGFEPFGCSVDPTTGNLAVVNFDSASISVYTGATGTPAVYSVPNNPIDEYTTYDNSGDLFVAGRNSSGIYALDEAVSGSTTFNSVSVNGGTIAFPGQIQWGGTYLLLGDQGSGSGSSVNQATVSGGTATIVKNVLLTGTSDVVAGYKRGSAAAGNATFAAPDFGANTGYTFTFPGAAQLSTIPDANEGPYGAVLVQKNGS